jgi:hypothetical protein
MSLKSWIINGLTALVLAGGLYSESNSQEFSPTRLEQRIEKEEAVKNQQPDRYAVLVRGDDEDRHIANISLAYQVLIEQGFKKENIYILGGYGTQLYYHPSDGEATRDNLETILTHLSKKVDKKDLFLLYLSAHGYAEEPVKEERGLKERKEEAENISAFCLIKNQEDRKKSSGIGRESQVEGINEKEFQGLVSQINAGGIIYVFDFCNDGGFAKRFGKDNSIAISSTSADSDSHCRENESFSGSFFQAFRKGSGADKNQDRMTSITEAYNYAKETHFTVRSGLDSPQLVSEIETEIVTLDYFPKK